MINQTNIGLLISKLNDTLYLLCLIREETKTGAISETTKVEAVGYCQSQGVPAKMKRAQKASVKRMKFKIKYLRF
ncbi:unnamed protein product [Eruca vesicaria subsp. sativa]|uniref:Uncharacterized protein n=1 Tax=Eruca vesicaria subsp. sativa TaxID=29727 RepID=A0ABC8J7F9_ERUVS|nr:unnamed protein product [Eruca vesicaria subsp. sativa]